MEIRLACLVCVLGLCVRMCGQIGAPPPTTQLPRAQQLPISGRAQSGSVQPAQSSSPGTTNSVNTINPSVQIQGAYQGSVPAGKATNQTVMLSFLDAIKRGLQYNLGAIGAGNAAQLARSQRLAAIAELLPDLTGSARENLQQVNLAAEGFRLQLPIPGFTFPSVVTFNNFDARASMTESLSLTGLRNFQASKHNLRSAELMVQDSRDLIALAVAGSYLQLIATASRITTAKAQVETAKTIHDQAVDRNQSGLNAHIDVNRSLVELQTQQQRLTSLANDYEKQKLSMARLIGMPMAQVFELADSIPYREVPIPDVNEFIQRAWKDRADVRAAVAQVQAAERVHMAAVGEYFPSVDINANYGTIGTTPTNQDHPTYTVSGGVQIPIFRSGRIRADIEAADAALSQRKAEEADAKARAEQDVRTAILDLATASEQVKVAASNRDLAAETLQQAQDRFRSGVADTVEVVQAQESVATSEQDYISALFSLNLAQVSLARAIGQTEQGIARLVQSKQP